MGSHSSLRSLDSYPTVSQGLEAFDDGFSRQIRLSDDPLFWWRMEVPAADMAEITDFKPSQQSDDTMAHCLAILLAGFETDSTVNVSFRNLAPNDLDPAQHRIVLNDTVQRLERWIEGAAEKLGLIADEPTLESQGSKVSMTVRFG